MVKITNGVDVFEVTRGAFDGIYSKQGYVLFDGKNPADATPPAEPPAKTEDELFLEALAEEPLSQWNKAEVKRFAALKGIDISGTKNVAEAKDLIKEFLEAQEQEAQDEE